MALAVLGCLAAGSGTGLTTTLVSCSPRRPTEVPRPLSAAEAQRLAEMRLANHRDGRAGLTAVVGAADAQMRVTGWVDWHRRVIYASVDGPVAGRDRGLVQAAPRTLAVRPAGPARSVTVTSDPTRSGLTTPDPNRSATPSAADRGSPATATATTRYGAADAPPPTPPGDGWRVRPLIASGARPAALDSLLALVFAAATDRPDPVDPLRRGASRWLGRERLDGTTVDVLLGPAMAAASTPSRTPSTTPRGTPTSTAAGTGEAAVRYWLDADARLHRLAATLPGHLPVLVDFDRTTRPEPAVIAALGGAPVRPRPVTPAEARLLARLRPAGQAVDGSGDGTSVTLTLPTLAGPAQPDRPAATTAATAGPGRDTAAGDRAAGRVTNLRGGGWITWYDPAAYLAVKEIDGTAAPLLLRADRDGVAVRTMPQSATDPAVSPGQPTVLPPLPPPVERAWSYRDWQGRGDPSGAPDLDLLIGAAFAAGNPAGRDADQLRTAASWLRPDVIGRNRVAVFEIRKPAEAAVPAGEGRLRYWVDRSGVLHRLELRTRAGVFAQLDIAPAQAPYLPYVPTG